MSLDFNNLQRYMTRRILLALLLLAVGCRAQAPAPSDVNRRVERQVRGVLQAPPYVNIAVIDRQPSKDFAGYDDVTVMLSAADHKQPVHFLISKDNSTLYSMSKMDLTKDPYQQVMEKIDTTGRPVRGNKDAKVTIVVYDDFQCPYCSRMHSVINSSLKTYGDRVKVVYKDFPLSDIHPWATRAAVDGQCLASLSGGAFWDYADFVHANGAEISGQKRDEQVQFAKLDKIAGDMGKRHDVDLTKLNACIKEQPKKLVDASVAEAEKLGINATPAIFVNGQKLDGLLPPSQFEAVLDQALKDAGQPIPNKAQPEPKKPAGQ
jgi:protein-disulfide isomerase